MKYTILQYLKLLRIKFNIKTHILIDSGRSHIKIIQHILYYRHYYYQVSYYKNCIQIRSRLKRIKKKILIIKQLHNYLKFILLYFINISSIYGI